MEATGPAPSHSRSSRTSLVVQSTPVRPASPQGMGTSSGTVLQVPGHRAIARTPTSNPTVSCRTSTIANPVVSPTISIGPTTVSSVVAEARAEQVSQADKVKVDCTTTRRWAAGEVTALLEYWLVHISDYKTKPKAQFYRKVVASPGMERKSEDQVRSKCTDIEKRYKDMHLKLATTGFGVEEEERTSLREWVEHKFPLYYRVDEILGGRSAVDPPVLFESGVSSTSTQPSINLTQSDEEELIELTQRSDPACLVDASSGNTLQHDLSDTGSVGETLTAASQHDIPMSENMSGLSSLHQHRTERNQGKRTASDTLSDSLAILSEKHLAFEREKLSKTLAFQWEKLEQTLKLENRKMELKMEQHREQIRISQLQHEELMQLRLTKLQEIVRGREGLDVVAQQEGKSEDNEKEDSVNQLDRKSRRK